MDQVIFLAILCILHGNLPAKESLQPSESIFRVFYATALVSRLKQFFPSLSVVSGGSLPRRFDRSLVVSISQTHS